MQTYSLGGVENKLQFDSLLSSTFLPKIIKIGWLEAIASDISVVFWDTVYTNNYLTVSKTKWHRVTTWQEKLNMAGISGSKGNSIQGNRLKVRKSQDGVTEKFR